VKKRIQLGVAPLVLVAMVSFAALPGCAQTPNLNRPPQHPAQTHPHNTPPHAAQPHNLPPAQNQNANRPPQTNAAPQSNFNNGNREANGGRAKLNQRQQLGVGAPRPWVDQMRSLSPQQRDNVLQNSRAFQNLSPDKQNKIKQQFNQWDRMSPAQRADLRDKEDTWRNLTPQQREHIKSDVLPRMRQMPWDRQQMIKQKLGVLKNMPESARNQRLADPNFTKGMSDEEKSTLQDLSHMHVGSAPDPPGE
jgi:Protein of unknown function (DUF3106)